ncbi:cytochrome C551 [Candidatus Beckwithbacteria bacterium CG10_big_fil_rev_8_21_14_0_10_34_10]|uniref:Cytochrome C551 n=1 Tax=Candidatus Beckwithbacteria bacterium CG10_big_fil_rev_8_21_14_0_10_34_10 TaxID=1974495 RepID=A0A2H0W8M7_9BACT|nr:MAG: cytochrome C551 [Candidatus Beckwithbacteria bacterium CG10_big_fil_rev_8_21_14_0_10_34_10]
MENSNIKDQALICQECSQTYAWTTDEQEYYKKKGFEKPTHCPICRAVIKEASKDKFRGKIKRE